MKEVLKPGITPPGKKDLRALITGFNAVGTEVDREFAVRELSIAMLDPAVPCSVDQYNAFLDTFGDPNWGLPQIPVECMRDRARHTAIPEPVIRRMASFLEPGTSPQIMACTTDFFGVVAENQGYYLASYIL